jgi:hypothetical protein
MSRIPLVYHPNINYLIPLSSFSASPWVIRSTEEQQRGRDLFWLGLTRAGGNWGWGSSQNWRWEGMRKVEEQGWNPVFNPFHWG